MRNLDCLSKGLTYKAIADQLGISIDTIRTYLRRIYEKLHVRSRSQAVAKYTHFPNGEGSARAHS